MALHSKELGEVNKRSLTNCGWDEFIIPREGTPQWTKLAKNFQFSKSSPNWLKFGVKVSIFVPKFDF